LDISVFGALQHKLRLTGQAKRAENKLSPQATAFLLSELKNKFKHLFQSQKHSRFPTAKGALVIDLSFCALML
jgi:hypothetical protein